MKAEADAKMKAINDQLEKENAEHQAKLAEEQKKLEEAKAAGESTAAMEAEV